MKITNEQLRQIIKEELEAVLKEDHPGYERQKEDPKYELDDFGWDDFSKKKVDPRAGKAERDDKAEWHRKDDERIQQMKDKQLAKKRKERAQRRDDKQAAEQEHDAVAQMIMQATGRHLSDEMLSKLQRAKHDVKIVDEDNPTPAEIRKIFKQVGIPIKGLGRKFKSFFGFEE